MASLALACLTFGLASAPAQAQSSTARWKPRTESIVVRAGASRNWMAALSASRLGKALMISASMPVPYSDLNLVNQPDVDELTRRIQVAARLICQTLDDKYPPTQYPLIEGYSGNECVVHAARDSMSEANTIIASIKR
jgi:UrcA family protein